MNNIILSPNQLFLSQNNNFNNCQNCPLCAFPKFDISIGQILDLKGQLLNICSDLDNLIVKQQHKILEQRHERDLGIDIPKETIEIEQSSNDNDFKFKQLLDIYVQQNGNKNQILDLKIDSEKDTEESSPFLSKDAINHIKKELNKLQKSCSQNLPQNFNSKSTRKRKIYNFHEKGQQNNQASPSDYMPPTPKKTSQSPYKYSTFDTEFDCYHTALPKSPRSDRNNQIPTKLIDSLTSSKELERERIAKMYLDFDKIIDNTVKEKCNEWRKEKMNEEKMRKNEIFGNGYYLNGNDKCNGKVVSDIKQFVQINKLNNGTRPLQNNLLMLPNKKRNYIELLDVQNQNNRQFLQKTNLTLTPNMFNCTKQNCCNNKGKGFRNKHDLARHDQIHTNKKWFACRTCGEHFGRKEFRDEHEKKHELKYR